MGLFRQVRANFATWSDHALTIALLLGAAIIIAIALQPNHPLIKAIVLAYIVFP